MDTCVHMKHKRKCPDTHGKKKACSEFTQKFAVNLLRQNSQSITAQSVESFTRAEQCGKYYTSDIIADLRR